MAKQPMAATETEYERYRRLLPPRVDLELVVLKGHLLIEEQQGISRRTGDRPHNLLC
jgi:hypothetical protein